MTQVSPTTHNTHSGMAHNNCITGASIKGWLSYGAGIAILVFRAVLTQQVKIGVSHGSTFDPYALTSKNNVIIKVQE
ncbi:hypothetical protein PLUA15_460057 [Pseudomonas lundensis]|uniref:Uncharacterized protein n=1 Tax=Pseudomonas lundensis TaxID=86185 RepID=A0AAX2HBT9_9PSED|nr:hypothetical protein PLUA15_460057 [Pseudomonas lundensis]